MSGGWGCSKGEMLGCGECPWGNDRGGVDTLGPNNNITIVHGICMETIMRHTIG